MQISQERLISFSFVLCGGMYPKWKHHKAGPNVNANYHNLRNKQNTLQTLMNKQKRRRSLHNMGGLKKKHLGIWKRRLPNSAYICERESEQTCSPQFHKIQWNLNCQMMLFARPPQPACRRITHSNSMNGGQEKTSFDFMSWNHDEATVVSSDEESLQRPPKWRRVERKWCRTCGADVVIWGRAPRSFEGEVQKVSATEMRQEFKWTILVEFDDEYHITTSRCQANCSTTSTHEATGSTHINFVRAKITLS